MIRLSVLSGGRAGTTEIFRGSRVTVGRHPDADMALHPEIDLPVSAHHAILVLDRQGWSIRDLDSRNGTLLNGNAVSQASRLSNGDHVQLGGDGPELRITIGDGADPARAHRSRLRQHAVAISSAALALVTLAMGIGWIQDRNQWTEERSELMASVDSTLEAGASAREALEGRVTGLRQALDASERRIASLRSEVSRASKQPSGQELDDLRADLQVATQALRRQQLAASMDFDAIEAQNRNAITLVYAESADGEASVATGFAATPDGIIVTNHHVVIAADGTRPSRIGVQFTGSEQVFPARIVAEDQASDLALLKLENLLGSVPTVAEFGSTGDSVSVVAMVGYPLAATQARVSDRSGVPTPLVSAGVVLDRSNGVLEIQGYGTHGASGSPVFDGKGEVVGIVYGGRPSGPNPTVLAIPVQKLMSLIDRLH